jgi:hypothetical protein
MDIKQSTVPNYGFKSLLPPDHIIYQRWSQILQKKSVGDKWSGTEEKQMGKCGLVWNHQILRRIFCDSFWQLQFKAPYMTYFTSEWLKKKLNDLSILRKPDKNEG